MQNLYEIHRLQKLAGILTENNKIIYEEKSEKDVENALSSVTDSLMASIKDIPKDSLEKTKSTKKEKQPINEEAVSLVISGILAAPKLLEWIGKAVGWISKKLGGKTTGKNWEKAGKKLEKTYLKIIITLLKWTGFLKDYWTDEVYEKGKTLPTRVKNDQKLLVTAKTIYAVILGVAGLSAGYGAVHSASVGHAAIAGLETGLFGVKIKDIHHIHDKLKGQLGDLEADTHRRELKPGEKVTADDQDKFGYGK